MQDTGMVRRIDELGRVVIPKEIRKTLRIKEGDPLEIYTDKEELVLRKYSPIASLGDFSSSVAEGVEKITEKSCIITDTDKVVFVTGKDKGLEGKTLSDKMNAIMKERKSVLIASGEGADPVCVTESDKGAENQIIVPIVSGGDCYGTVVVFDNDKTKRFNSGDVKFARLCAFVLSKQFEN